MTGPAHDLAMEAARDAVAAITGDRFHSSLADAAVEAYRAAIGDLQSLAGAYNAARGLDPAHFGPPTGTKLLEEAGELVQALADSGSTLTDHVREELGDCGIALGNVARRLGATVEDCMRLKTLRDTGRGPKGVVDRSDATRAHFASRHGGWIDAAATDVEVERIHYEDHYGPGTMRGHSPADRGFDPGKVEQVRREAQESRA